MTCKLTVHRIITEESEDGWNEEDRLVDVTIPCPYSFLLTGPEKNYNIRKRERKRGI